LIDEVSETEAIVSLRSSPATEASAAGEAAGTEAAGDGAISTAGGFSSVGNGNDASAGFAISAGGVSVGLKAATCSLPADPAADGGCSAGAAVTFAASFAFSMTGGSTRSVASIGSVVSGCWAKGTSGAARQDELLAKDSWAARSRAAAPSPKTRSDIDNMIAANRKRKPGSMARGILAEAGERERGGH
jgi:hypothetical protein